MPRRRTQREEDTTVEQGGAKRVVGCLVVFLLLGAIPGFAFRRQITAFWYSRAFPLEKIRELEATDYAPGAESVEEGAVPYRRGRVLILARALLAGDIGHATKGKNEEIEPPALHEAYFKLDGNVRARSPEEVDTLIIAHREFDKQGMYVTEGGRAAGSAMKEIWVLRVFDMRRRILVGTHRLSGDSARAVIESHESKIGASADLAAFVASMPVRN